MTTLKQKPEVINDLILREINNTLADIAASLKLLVTFYAKTLDVNRDWLNKMFARHVEKCYLDAQLLEDNEDSNVSYGFRGIKNNKETEKHTNGN